MTGAQRLAGWCYAALLRLYPREYRDQFGDEQRGVFAQRASEAAELGRRMFLWTVAGELICLPAAAVRQLAWAILRWGMDEQEAQRIRSEVIPWAGVGAILPLFLLPVVSALSAAPGAWGYVAKGVGVLVVLAVLAALLLGMERRFPRWWLPYGGALAAVAFFYLLMSLGSIRDRFGPLAAAILPRVAKSNQILPVEAGFWSTGLFWLLLALMLAILLASARLLPAMRGLGGKLRADWTYLSLMVYGAAASITPIWYDRRDAVAVILPMAFLALGAVAALRVGSSWQRLACLIAGSALAGLVVVLAGGDGLAQHALWQWIWLVMAMLLPALIGSLVWRRAAPRGQAA